MIFNQLSPRQKEILNLIVQGLINEEIAQKLFMSQRTLKTHLDRIYTLYDVHGKCCRARLVVKRFEELGFQIKN